MMMAKYCSYKNCKSKSTDGILIFKMPTNPDSQLEWRAFIAKSRGESVDSIKSLRLCEIHFSKDDLSYQYRGSPRLKPGATPLYDNKKVKTN
jgi:hypothetical protein